MKIDQLLNKGRIADILSALCTSNIIIDIASLPESVKLDALLTTLQLSLDSFDQLLATNSPVLRTLKGHAFETVFKRLLTSVGVNAEDIGGDQSIDLVVNGFTLQLKTPYILIPTLKGAKHLGNFKNFLNVILFDFQQFRFRKSLRFPKSE